MKGKHMQTKAKQVSVSLPTYQVELIDELCAKTGLKKSTVIQQALDLYFSIGQN